MRRQIRQENSSLSPFAVRGSKTESFSSDDGNSKENVTLK